MFAFIHQHYRPSRVTKAKQDGRCVGDSLGNEHSLTASRCGGIHYVDSGYNIISMPRPEEL